MFELKKNSFFRECVKNTQTDKHHENKLLNVKMPDVPSPLVDGYYAVLGETTFRMVVEAKESILCDMKFNDSYDAIKKQKIIDKYENKQSISCFLAHSFDKDVNSKNIDITNVKKINVKSAQSNVFIGDYRGDKENVIIKIAKNNLNHGEIFHEYYVGIKVFNEISKYTPNLMFTYGMFYCNEPSISLGDKIELCDGNPLAKRKIPHLVVENIKNSMTIRDFEIEEMCANNFELIKTILIQIGLTLICLSEKLATHNDLHSNNYLIVKLNNPTVLKYSIPTQNGQRKDIFITTRYLVKLIDYGISSFYDNGVYVVSSFRSFKNMIHRTKVEQIYFPASDYYKIINGLYGVATSLYKRNLDDPRARALYNYTSYIFLKSIGEIKIYCTELTNKYKDDKYIQLYQNMMERNIPSKRYSELIYDNRYSLTFLDLELVVRNIKLINISQLLSTDTEIKYIQFYSKNKLNIESTEDMYNDFYSLLDNYIANVNYVAAYNNIRSEILSLLDILKEEEYKIVNKKKYNVMNFLMTLKRCYYYNILGLQIVFPDLLKSELGALKDNMTNMILHYKKFILDNKTIFEPYLLLREDEILYIFFE